MDGQVTIDALCEPGNAEAVRYVGQTRQELRRRYWGHLNEVNHNDSAKTRWVRALLAQGAKPLIRVLAVTDEAGANGLEEEYIRRLREQGCAILNDGNGRGHGTRRIVARKKEWQGVTLLLPPTLVQELRAIGGGERGAVSRVVQQIVCDALGEPQGVPAALLAPTSAQKRAVTIRLAPGVLAEVEALRRREYRSLAGQLVALVREALAARAGPGSEHHHAAP